MKIEQFNVSLFSSHKKSSEITDNESLQTWDSLQDTPKKSDRLVLSNDYQKLNQAGASGQVANDSGEEMLDPKLMSIVRAIESLTGKKLDLSFLKKGIAHGATFSSSNAKTSGDTANEGRVGWGIRYTKEHSEIHEEALAFSAMGNVKSEDGKSMDFSLALEMNSRTELHESVIFVAGDAKIDPLVLNFGTNTVTISGIKKDFDLNMDGKIDKISFVGDGSGFLAIDKNNDGIINNGSELFGPTKGNGFKELSEYDSDKNGWIDENDSVFNKLVIWTKDAAGNENLYSLKDKNVGALYLNKADTQFDLKDNTDKMQAFLRESSIYLKEDASGAGTMQEVDLVV